RPDGVFTQQAQTTRVGARDDLIGHVVIEERVEALGNVTPAIGRLLNPTNAVGTFVLRAAMPALVVPHHARATGPYRGERALAFISGLAIGVLVLWPG